MKILRFCTPFVSIFTIIAALTISAQSPAYAASQSGTEKSYIVVLRGAQDISQRQVAGSHPSRTIPKKRIFSKAFNGFTASLTDSEVKELENDPDVEYVAENRPVTLALATGLKATYYNNPNFTDMAMVRIDPTISFNWGRQGPLGVSPDTFSVRWEGEIRPRFSETYTFYVTTDDGVRLWVDDTLVVDNWINQSATEKSGKIALEADRTYRIKMEYVENTGYAVARLKWSSPSERKQIVPTDRLYPVTSSSVSAPTQVPASSPVVEGAVLYTVPTPTASVSTEPIPTPAVEASPIPSVSPSFVDSVDASPEPIATPVPSPSIQPPDTAPSGVSRIGVSLASTGIGVGVAIVDTGIDLTHPDLVDNIVGGVNCIDSTQPANDGHGHGTHVAGVVAAKAGNGGIRGVAPDAKLIPVKVLDDTGSGSWDSVICGLEWVTEHAAEYNIKVINMSLVGYGYSDNNCGLTNFDPMHTAVCRARDAGLTIVVAAANSSFDVSSFVPAAYDDAVITVSALADSDGRAGGLGWYTSCCTDDVFASFSNYGVAVDVGAPGVDIYSTYKYGSYAYMSGTSMSSPHVAGVAALYLSQNPEATWTQVKANLEATGEPIWFGHFDPSGVHPEKVVTTHTL